LVDPPSTLEEAGAVASHATGAVRVAVPDKEDASYDIDYRIHAVMLLAVPDAVTLHLEIHRL
jgi:hypothetical protein